jgi:hypothetical protein
MEHAADAGVLRVHLLLVELAFVEFQIELLRAAVGN